ncbi:NAD(P)/FAD-dependent oxidoreductase [Piscinibacter koreensis]|uniref:Tryptophan 7-halogenase n=1 Tax=Piscinibacter koreensis TaxID=2742824 RepID=A0A7Y6NK63_9BURK|nr:tryptophan 7-halogenase [Schlegelella koreensis]NUZ04681.1 tryptophan 7-halogenase [Schlegelella koreensis]
MSGAPPAHADAATGAPDAESHAAHEPADAARHDVVIVGGGLAGLTLALQLKRRFADIDILVIERRAHPVPVAAHKVGESSVEIGAHYFAKVLGLEEHLKTAQLKKFGFRFFFSEGRRDIDQVTEIGASRYLAVPSYQIDRGIFENFLGAECARRGIRFVDGARVQTIDLAAGTSGEPHRTHYLRGGREHRVDSRWLVDAGGRAGLLKRKLGLAEANGHAAHAVWFRIQDRITLDDWVADPMWRASCEPPARWMSTNHLVGAGYWVWLIPLASGSHSVGIVADPALHPLESMDTFDKAMEWFRTYQPRLYDELDGKRDKLQDFAFFRRFSYGCKQVFSADRWALTGEAGLFLDPFYSPGSDFIAIGNTYITELIGRDRAGQHLGAHAQLYDQIYHSFYASTLALYEGQYPIFGDPGVLPVKVIWDYSYYWGVLSQLFFHGRLADLAALGALRGELMACQQLNVEMQRFLRAWSAVSDKRNPAVMLDQAALPWFRRLNASLNDELDDAQFRARIRASTALLRELAGEIVDRACGAHPGLDASALRRAIEAAAAGGPACSGFGDGPLLFEVPDAARNRSTARADSAAPDAAACASDADSLGTRLVA